MATNFKTIWNGVKLKAKSILTSDTKGEMEVDETSGKLNYHNGTSRSPVVTEVHTATVTNKTIDADNNTISNLEVDNLKTGVLNTSTTITGATDTQIPSALAVKTYVDDKTAAQNEASEIIVSPAINGNTNAQAVMEDHESRIISAVSDIATNATNISDHINDTLGAHLASAIGTTPSGNLSATDVQTALNELQSDIDTRATITSLNNHLTDTVDAHDASAISVVPTGNLAASDAQTAFNELQTNIDSLYNDTNVVANDLNNHIIDIDDAHDASAISNIPSGNLAATDVQGALNELQTDVDTRATSSALTTHASTSSGVHGVVGTIVGTSDSQSLTNKTIDADLNTISNIDNADIKAAAAIDRTKLASGTANKVIVNDGSGVMSEMANVTDSSTALILSNLKHIELQSIDDSTSTGADATIATFSAGGVRLTNVSLASIANIPAGSNGQQVVIFNRTGNTVTIKDSSAALGSASARVYTGTNANITLVDKAALILSYDSVSSRWQVIGGSGGGASALSALSDVTISSPANNQVLTYDSTTGKWVNRASQSSASVDTLTQQLFDNAVLGDFTQTGLTLSTSNPIKGTVSALLTHQPATSQSFKQVISVDRKFRGYAHTLSLSTRSTAASANLTILVTDETNSATLLSSSQITTGQITSAVFNTASSTTVTVTDLSILNRIKAGASITGSGIPANTVVTAVGSGTITISNAATATATGVSLKVSVLPVTQKFSFTIPANCSSISYTVTALQESGSPESYIDDVQIYLGQQSATSYSLTQTTFNATDWTSYTPTFTGFGTVSTHNMKWRQVGSTYEISGTFVLGTSTATEQRISLPNGATISSLNSTLEEAGAWSSNANLGTNLFKGLVLREPSVSYMTFGYQGNTIPGLSKTASSGPYPSAGSVISIEAKFPIAGLTANTTTTSTIPLSSSVLVTQPDFNLTLSQSTTVAANTVVPFDTILKASGSGITNTSGSFTATESGVYTVSTTLTNSTASNISAQILVDNVVRQYETSYPSAGAGITLTHTEYLNVGQVVTIKNLNNTAASGATVSITKNGSTKILNPSSDQKIQIPTHQLRFEGASARGSTDTAIVKFDTQTITQGDGFTVTNTAANGTVVTIRKSGLLSATLSLAVGTLGNGIAITKNQSVLTAYPTTSEILSNTIEPVSGTYTVPITVSNIPVNVGDVIRVCAETTPTGSARNIFNISLQETSVAVALQNVTPTYDNSDSAIRLNTGNGFGSTNANVRRYSNLSDSFGTDITYTDSAALGAYFTVNKDGLYNIIATDQNSTTSSFDLAITKNQTTLTSGANVLAISDTPNVGGGVTNAVASGVYLAKGDVVRVLSGTPANTSTSSPWASVSISKVGKTSGTVDVTPFVQIPQNDVEAIEALTATSTFGSTNTGVPVLNITKNTNLGIIQVISNTVDGTSFRVLKDCEVKLSTTMWGSAAGNSYYLTKNATILTATSPDGVINYATTAGNGYGTPSSSSVKLLTGDILRIQRSSVNMTNVGSTTITATAISNSIASSTQQVSSDTMSFVFKSTAIDPNTDPIGTFNTYTFTANTGNTFAIATTAPTQSVSSMNVNGIQVFGRAYTAASTAAQPARVDIFIGKGLKDYSTTLYASSAKSTPVPYHIIYNPSNGNSYGTIVTYNEVTGILSIDAGINISTGSTRSVDSVTSYTNGYFVFNASKAPSLVTVPQLQQRVAYLSDVKASATDGGSSVATTWTTRTLNTLVDNTGFVTSLSANQFTLPAGTYQARGFGMTFGVGNTSKLRLRNITDGTTSVIGSSNYATTGGATTNVTNVIEGEFTITSSKTFALQYYSTVAQATNGLGVATASGESELFAQVAITKIK